MRDAPFGGGRDGFPCPQLQAVLLGDGRSLARQPLPSQPPRWDFGICERRLPASANFALLSSLLTPGAGWEAAEK